MANLLQLAEAQFIGYEHGVRGYNARTLAKEMGLTKEEWMKLREGLVLSESDKQDIDKLFEKEA